MNNISNEEYDRELAAILHEKQADGSLVALLLAVPGMYEALSEEFNYDVTHRISVRLDEDEVVE